MSIKSYIPNAITQLNLFSGCIAVYFASINELKIAAFFALLGIFFDFFDGFFARILKVQSELGLQLDSLADMITSGLVPGMFMFQLLKQSHLVQDFFPITLPSTYAMDYLPFLGFIITLASSYRLAKFNIDTRQTTSFIGLPTPANTLLIISLGLVGSYQPESFIGVWLTNTYFLMAIVVFCSYILNAELPLFALKFNTWGFRNNWMRYILVITALTLVIILGYVGILVSILLYVLLSIITKTHDI